MPVTQVARELGINMQVLRDWKRKAEQAGNALHETETSAGQAESDEVRRLRRDLVAWMRQARSLGDEEEADAETAKALRALGYLN